MSLPISEGHAPNGAPDFGFGPAYGKTPFDAAGGIERVRELVDRFYAHMGGDEVFASTRALYPGDLVESKEKLFEFLVGWLGGPQLYIEKRGHPRLRARHMPFPIGDQARDHWMEAMGRAMDEMGIEGDLRRFLDHRFRHVADFMRNR